VQVARPGAFRCRARTTKKRCQGFFDCGSEEPFRFVVVKHAKLDTVTAGAVDRRRDVARDDALALSDAEGTVQQPVKVRDRRAAEAAGEFPRVQVREIGGCPVWRARASPAVRS